MWRELKPNASLVRYWTDILLNYRKKTDPTLNKASPPDGACGWHGIAQVLSKDKSNSLLHLYETRVILPAQSLLVVIVTTNNEMIMGTREALLYATDWMKKKSKNMRIQYSDRELCSDNFAMHLQNIPATLFVQPSLAPVGATPFMPSDPKFEWLILHSTAQVNNLDPENYHNAFPNIIIVLISKGEFFVQLAGSHYFHFPDLPNDDVKYRTAVKDLAYQYWDKLAGALLLKRRS